MEKKTTTKIKIKYNSKWEKKYPWIMPDPNDNCSAKCKICKDKFSIEFEGISQHMQTERHQYNLNKDKELNSMSIEPIHFKNEESSLEKNSKICRICLKTEINKNLISVFESDSNNIEIAKKIYDISGIFIDKTDSLPNQICIKCNETLSIAYEFRIICQQSDIQLKIQKSNEELQVGEIKFEMISNLGSEVDNEFFTNEKKEWLSDLENNDSNKIEDSVLSDNDNKSNHSTSHDTEKKDLKIPQTNANKKRFCSFKLDWLKKYDFVKRGRDRGHVFCTVCNCEFSIAYSGEKVIISHMNREKHGNNLILIKKGKKSISAPKVEFSQEELEIIPCEVCKIKFSSKRELKTHLKCHTDYKEFECEICKKRFRQLMHLKRHRRVHTGEKPFACKYCDKKFGDDSTKIKHERVHTNERPYLCQTCGKAFMISDSLNKHILVHTGEKPFSCEVCNVKFARKTHLQTHYKSLTHKNRAEKISIADENKT